MQQCKNIIDLLSLYLGRRRKANFFVPSSFLYLLLNYLMLLPDAFRLCAKSTSASSPKILF